MNKGTKDRKTVHKHFDVIMGHTKDSDENIARKKHDQEPLSDIIAKFHKIKEERFKPKVKNHFQNSKSPYPQSRAENVLFDPNLKPPTLESLLEQRPRSASAKAHGNKVGGMGGRRMSLPSLFHPLTPLPVKSESTENIEKEEEEVKVYHARRRHSVSLVMTEYSKHNLHHLSKIHERKIQELNDVVGPKKEKKKPKPQSMPDEDKAKWLTGDDIHAFYNMWEKPRKLNWKKKLHIRKVLPRTEAVTNHKDDDDDGDDYQRPRVFSF